MDRTEVEAKLITWLKEEGYLVKPQTDPAAYFNLLAESPDSVASVNLAQSKQAKDRIEVGARLKIEEWDLRKLRELPFKARETFHWDLSSALAAAGVHNRMIPNAVEPVEIELWKSIWYDGLSKDRFMTTIRNIFDAVLLILIKFQQSFGDTEIPPD